MLAALVIWQSSQVPWQRLYLGWIGRSTWVRPRCFKMSALVPQPGLTMSRSILPPGTAINLIWWVKNSFDFLINICYDQLISKGRNSSGICFPPHSWQGCQYWPNGQLNTLAGGEKKILLRMFSFICVKASFLAAFAVVYGLHDLRSGGQMTLFMASAYNAFQVTQLMNKLWIHFSQRLAWSFSLAWVIFSCTKVSPINS